MAQKKRNEGKAQEINFEFLVEEEYEREDVQKKTFAKWINSQLSKRNSPPITDLFYDLRDGTKLLTLLEILTDSKYKRERGRMRVHHLNNVGRALKVLEEQRVKLVNISNEDIVDGSPKITLGLVWAIILHWQVQGVLKEVMSELQQTNLEKTLLAWCRQTTQGYQGVDVRNFTTSWRDGLAFCAILHRHRPDFFDWPVMAKKHPYARLDNAFRMAQEHLGIERLLDPEDVNTQNPDKKSLMMYVMCLFQALPHSSISMDSLNISVKSDSSFSLEASDTSTKERPLSSISTGLGNYQQTLEEVLTWLLGAEDRLAGMPPIAENTKEVKDQFHELEDLMLDLTARQGSIGDVLGEGSRLLRENQIGEEEGEEVRVQMKLLNTRWEELRIKAMDRQTSLHEQLMKLQQEELDSLKQWLTKTEDRIANMSELGPTYEDLENQISTHQDLQNDLEAEQENINSLSNMVVVVDENNVDSTYTSLEDELNALGERWAHICKWAEQRWLTLQNLQVQWCAFEKDLKRFQNWLNDKENLLKEMESNPTEDKQELYKQAAELKVLESEMEVETRRQTELNERSSTVLSHLPHESSAREDFPLVLETLEDRLDCLISILQAQSQRLLSNGIDLATLPVEGETIMYTTTTTTTTTVVGGGSSPQRKISSSEKRDLTPKRQKMTGKKQEEFLSAVLALNAWMEGVEERLNPTIAYSLPISEMEELYREIEGEINNQKEEFDKVLSLGHSATSETATIGESTVENEIKMTSVKSKWTSLEKLLHHLKQRIQFNELLSTLRPKLEDFKKEFSGLEEWVNSIQSTTHFDPSIISDQIKECQEKKEIAKKKEMELAQLERKSQNLPSLWPEEKDEVLRNFQALTFDFRNIVMRITNSEFILNEQAKSIDQTESLSKASSVEEGMEVSESQSSHLENELSLGLEELSSWLAKVEEQLEGCPAVAPLPKMQDELIKLKIMVEEVDSERVKLSCLNKSLGDSKSSLANKVEELNKRWKRIVDALVNRVSDIEKSIDTQRQFEEEISGLRSWLGEVEAFLEAEEAAIGDIETLQAQLEQSNALQDDIETLRSNVANIGSTARHFQSTGDPELKESVTEQITALNERWEKAVEKATKQNGNLKEALEKSRKVTEEGREMKEWIEGMEARIPSLTSVETTSELNKICSELSEIERQVQSRSEAFDQLNKLGNDMLTLEKAQPCMELTQLFEHLNEHWNVLKQESSSRKEQASSYKRSYEQFKKLCSEESHWLDQLEEKLQKSNLKSADAEEISEALYELDNFVGSHPNCLEKAQDIGNQLTKEGVMTVAVQNSIHNLTSRFELLTSKANEEQQRLEGGVEEAQDLEREYVNVLESLSSSLKLMNQFPEGSHITKIEKQLVSHQEVLQKMELRVESYRTQGKGQAAQRLQDQLTHLVKQYEEVEEKLKVIKQSKDFDEKLLSISEQLTAIDEKSRQFDVKSVDSDHLESQLNHCMEIYRSLSLVKSNVEGIIATGRKIVKECMTSDPDTLTMQLDQLKALYNQLGGSVTEQRGRLESGLKQSKKLEKESSQLEEWLSATERELDLREASLPIQNYEQELEFAQHAYDDLIRKKPVLANVKESLTILVSLFGNEVTTQFQERVQDQNLSWERVQTRLTNRITNLKKEQGKKEDEMEKFIMKIGEIQAWLEKTERELDKFEELPSPEKDTLLKSVSSEVQDYKTKLEETKESCDDFVAHGTLFESRLEPEMTRIRRRLEHITGLIKVKETDLSENQGLQDTVERPMTKERDEYRNKSCDVLYDIQTAFESPVGADIRSDNDRNIPSSEVKEDKENSCNNSGNPVDKIFVSTKSIDVQETEFSKENINDNSRNASGKTAENKTEATKLKPSKLDLVEVEEIKTTISHLSYQIPTISIRESSRGILNLKNEHQIPQGKLLKRKKNEKAFNESETEPENLDDVIAGLKQVAEKDDSVLIERVRRKNLCKDDTKNMKDRLPFLKTKREDDDLESLTSVDTDMAPMSENSRDLECTYSDLESISESVSSKCDPLIGSNKDNLVTTSAVLDINATLPDSYNPNIFSGFYLKEEPHLLTKSSLDSSKHHSSSETLPVEKLQAMIAELDEVLSSDDSTSSEELKSSKINISEMVKTSEKLQPSHITTEEEMKTHEDGTNAKESLSKPTEITYQTVHVDGSLEFAKAVPSIQKSQEESPDHSQKVMISIPEVERSCIVKSQNKDSELYLKQNLREHFEARKVSIQARETSDLKHGVTMELPLTNFAAYPEQATLVKIESYPGSEESLVNESKKKDQTTYLNQNQSISSVNANNNETLRLESFDQTNQWIKSVDEKYLEVNSERKEAAKESTLKEENVDDFLSKVTLMVDQISLLRDRGDILPKYTEASATAEEYEREVSQLEPDVATLISKGDTLTLKTHMSDVPKANAIRVAVNNLRLSWMDLKERGETLKNEAERLKKVVKDTPHKAQDFVRWLDEISKRLESANNDEKQIKNLEKEIGDKKSEFEQINSSGELLKKYKHEELQHLITLINIRWTEINVHFSQYQKSGVVQKSIGDKFHSEQDERAVVPDFLAKVNKVRESIFVLSRQMNSKVMSGKPYDNLREKEEELNNVKKELERLKPKVEGVENERLNTMKKANAAQTDQVRRVIDKLREEWAQVNRGFNDKYELWVHCTETRRSLNKTMEEFSSWMDSIEEKVRTTAHCRGLEAKATQKEMEKQVTLKHRPSQGLQTLSKDVTEGLSSDEGRILQDRVDILLRRWRALLLELSARRERIASEEVSKKEIDANLESIICWVDQGQSLLDSHVNVTDESALSAHRTAVKNHLAEMDSKVKLFNELKNANESSASALQMRTVETNLMKVVKCLPEHSNKVDMKLRVVQSLILDADSIYRWLEDLRVKLALRDMIPEEMKRSRDLLREKTAIYEALDNTYWALSQDAESKGLGVSESLKSRMNSIEARLKTLENQFSTTELMTSLNQSSDASVVTSSTSYKVSMAAATTAATPISSDTSITTAATHVVKLEENVMERSEPVSMVVPPVPFPKTDSGSPTLILAALDKSILQIRDWLTLMQQMSSEQVAVVGDSENIRKLIEKQKSVLRELESKKPQLDELVASADSLKEDGDRTQLHQQVSKLRDHWDETNSSVLARKTQLDAMLNDTHKFDSKRVELETWLSRMESRFERMNPIARTSELLDQQIREQKAFHAEVHQYKHHMELFSQMITRLVTIYQNDDTRRLKKAAESINQRYANLNANIISRGKSLYAAMNSSHNLSKALEKFISWLSEAESSVNAIENEVDKMPPSSGIGRRDSTISRGPYVHLKDLQSEIESHKDVLASLNATGQKLLGTLENQDEAMLLHRRLGEMNHRWNTLKYKSIAIRNRLEGTAENWNSLLLSLRELIEWVIRKDTELTALGPVVGDLKLLAKYENDLTIFRRGLDEKQPVIESNLKSGRQLIASEPPLSDTSDSEAGRDLDGDARYRGEESTRDLTRSVRREVTKLSEKWAALWERAANLAAQVSLANKKLGVLLKTVEEVGSRLEESEKVVGAWGPVPQDQNLAEQYVHNIRKFRETLPDLQRGIDDVNDQAARFSAHNVPLTPANSAALHDLNNRWKNLETNVNDRWRQVAGKSREVSPLTPAQLASSVTAPWERATATNKVPYYINHAQETTHWDHPQMMDLLDSLSEFNHIKFSAYRTATKLRCLQKKLALDRAKLQMVTDVFDEHGLRGQNDRLIDVNDMIVVLSTLYGRISSDNNDVNTTLTTDLCLNWLLNVYDSQRTGQMRVLSFRVGLICLCRGHLEEKYRYMFRLIADPNRLVDQRKLGLLLHDCVQVPRQLGEVAAFGGSNIEPSVRSCFTKAGKDRETIEAVHFLTWVQQEPQSLVWLAVLHRVAASESVQHQVKCNICKTSPIVGLRYRCLKCLSFDMCQRCFFEGRSTKSHKITHPMHEYCTETRAGDEMKDFTKALKNKFKSKRSLQKHTKKGYLPVQTVLEGDPIESPSPSPSHNVSSQDMHSRLELYASRLAEVELRTNSNSTPDSEDEHGLIAQYCQSLSSTDAPFPVPKSPLQIMASVDADQKDELEQMIRDLEEENRALQAEYERLKSEQPTGSTSEETLGQRSEAEMLAEAKLLREHKGRLEARMNILEDHNRQLEAQLQRLRQLLVEQQSGMGSPNKSGTLQTKSVTASQLAMDSPAKINGHSSQGGQEKLGVGNPGASTNRERVNDSLSEDQSDENDYDNTVSPHSG